MKTPLLLLPASFVLAALIFPRLVAAEEITPVPNKVAYESWRMAGKKDGNTPIVPPPTSIQAPEGFKVELIRVAEEDEDSWISLCFDDKNRLFLGMEDKGILRLSFSGKDGTEVVEAKVVNDHLEEPRGLLWAYDSLYVNANDSKGFYRLRDTTGDDVFDEEKLLLKTEGGVGHGRNHLRLGPDGMIYIVHGNNPQLANPSPDSPFKNYGEDQLIPNPWDDSWNTLPAPAGQIVRTDKDGTKFEAICGGLRNPLDIDFNLDGEPFVYDADSEWDAGLAWYKPTRILHIIPGGEYGWRRGTGKWPDYYEDSLPAVYDVGLGSPTGVGFAYKSNFPEPWRSSFMIADWSYGRILAVDIEPDWASYKGTEARHFLSGRPLNLTDFVFGPDGAMWFTTGGRRTQSALYRVSWTGAKETKELKPNESMITVNQSYELQLSKNRNHPEDLKELVDRTGFGVRRQRFQRRILLESVPVETWRQLALDSENPWAIMALARVGNENDRHKILKILCETIQNRYRYPSIFGRGGVAGAAPALSISEESTESVYISKTIKQGSFDEQPLLTRLRAIQLACIRQGPPTDAEKQMLRDALEPLYPHTLQNVNHELCEMLVYLRSDKVLRPTLTLIEESDDTRDWSHYLVFLRYLEDEMWTTGDRRRYLEGLKKFDSFAGGRWWIRTGEDLRKEFVARLPEDETKDFAALIPPQQPKVEAPIIEELDPARFVKSWTMEDFADADFSDRDVKRGAAVYVKAQCAVCHKKAGNAASERAFFGPDLSQIGARFGPADMLESMIHPSLVIGDKYRNPAGPNVSTMPPGLINLLEKDEVLDLIAYLRAEP